MIVKKLLKYEMDNDYNMISTGKCYLLGFYYV